jgi:glutathione S-transferase
MSRLRIYGIARTRAFRALWIAEELGLDYEHLPIEIGPAGARKPDYLAINPNGRLPAIDDDGFTLWESLAITLYLAKKHGGLYPTTLEGEAKAWQWSLWAVQEVDRGVNIWSLHAMRLPPEDRDPQRLAEALKILQPPFKVLDGALAGRSHLLGKEFTVADLNVAAVISRAIDMDLSETPQLARWLARCLERPAARKARALRAQADAAVPIEVTRAIARHNRL